MCNGRISLNSESSLLETLPRDILVRVSCGVDHEDLKQLFNVSRTIREVDTPKKKTFVFLNPFDFEDTNGFKKNEAPNVPLTKEKSKSRLNGKKLDANISQVLFAFMDEE
ncbi:F-box protein [Glycine max]|nr:F-box protein [Glycine max]